MATLNNRLEALERRGQAGLTPLQRWECGRVLEVRREAEQCGEQQTLRRYGLAELPPEPPRAVTEAFWRMITPTDIAEAKARLSGLRNRYAPA